jgi:hypothetical protein
LYGYETSPLILREKRRLTVFEKRVVRKTFEPWRDEVKGQWTRIHEEIYDLHSSPHIIQGTK